MKKKTLPLLLLVGLVLALGCRPAVTVLETSTESARLMTQVLVPATHNVMYHAQKGLPDTPEPQPEIVSTLEKGFRGYDWGTPKEQMAKLGFYCCTSEKRPGARACTNTFYSGDREYCFARNTKKSLDTTTVWDVMYAFESGRFIGVHITYPGDNYPDMQDFFYRSVGPVTEYKEFAEFWDKDAFTLTLSRGAVDIKAKKSKYFVPGGGL